MSAYEMLFEQFVQLFKSCMLFVKRNSCSNSPDFWV